MSDERPETCAKCGTPVVWCECEDILKSCPFCETMPIVGGGKLVKPTCEHFGDYIFEWGKWQSRPLESAARAEGYKDGLSELARKFEPDEVVKGIEIQIMADQLKRAYEGSDGNGIS